LTKDEFFKVVQQRFPGKVYLGKMRPFTEESNAEGIRQFGFDLWFRYRVAAEEYPAQAWLLGSECPNCGAGLLGFEGSFTWGITRGEGYCSRCKKVQFQYYHNLLEGELPMQGFAVIGYSEEEAGVEE
jgi:hypothetical protein